METSNSAVIQSAESHRDIKLFEGMIDVSGFFRSNDSDKTFIDANVIERFQCPPSILKLNKTIIA